jgi:anti-sigma regulatory factor (Ser/Thr protein kinase)
VDEAEQPGIVRAVGEAAANSIEHGYGMDGEGKVIVSGSFGDDDELTLVVRDGGTWRKASQTPNRGGRTAHAGDDGRG